MFLPPITLENCTEDPISVSIKFSAMFHAFFKIFIKGGALGKVDHYYIKKEYQAWGVPHYPSLETTPFLPERPGIHCLRMRVISEISRKIGYFSKAPCCVTLRYHKPHVFTKCVRVNDGCPSRVKFHLQHRGSAARGFVCGFYTFHICMQSDHHPS